jgi:predicted ferric reductase
MTFWEAVTWNVARAGGFTAYALLTLAVVLGLALSLRWQPNRWPRIINNELHNFLTLLSLVFTGIHVLAVWVDPFTNFGWSEVLIPFVSHYRPASMALGIIGLYLGGAVGVSTWLRPHIGYALWRRLHYLTLVLFALVSVHGIMTGSDTATWWAVGIYVTSIAAVGMLLVFRLAGSGAHASPTRAPRPSPSPAVTSAPPRPAPYANANTHPARLAASTMPRPASERREPTASSSRT